MKENVKLWCFIVLLPFFMAVGFDLYANFLSTEEQKAKLETLAIDPKGYQVSDLGYILLKYAPDQYHMTKDAIAPEVWEKWIDPILQLYTYAVALIPAVLFFAGLLIVRIFSGGSFSGSAVGKDKNAKSKDPQFKYKRR